MDTLGGILQDGVLLSLGLIAVGFFWRRVRTGSPAIDYRIAGMNLFEFVVDEVRLALYGAVRPPPADQSGHCRPDAHPPSFAWPRRRSILWGF